MSKAKQVKSAEVEQHDRIILFATGVRFSQIVFDTLLKNEIRPVAIVLPLYPPASVESLSGVEIDQGLTVSQMIIKAQSLSINVIYAPESLQGSLSSMISDIGADYILVACWPYLLSPEVTKLATKAALNIHPSLLPNYRGANPLLDQLSHREINTGVTLHLLSEAFDQGDILSQTRLDFVSKFPGHDELEYQSAEAGTGLFIDAMKKYNKSGWTLTRQSKNPD